MMTQIEITAIYDWHMVLTFFILMISSILIALYFWSFEKWGSKFWHWIGTMGTGNPHSTDIHRKLWKKIVLRTAWLVAWAVPFGYLWLMANVISKMYRGG